jgi:hypothetical protein
MAVSTIGGEDKFFVRCKADDEIDGVKLESIIGYAIKQIDNVGKGTNEKDSYNKYCDALKKKLGSPEPYYRSLSIRDCSKEKIVANMWDLMPHKIAEFKSQIEKVADYAVGSVDMSVQNLGHLIYRENEKTYAMFGFSVLKIFRSGDNLEIIPSYMHVKGRMKESRFLIFSDSESEASIEYMHEKYILTEFDIKEIIEIEKQKSGSRWN